MIGKIMESVIENNTWVNNSDEEHQSYELDNNRFCANIELVGYDMFKNPMYDASLWDKFEGTMVPLGNWVSFPSVEEAQKSVMRAMRKIGGVKYDTEI